jgi:hypothetical protein
MKPTTDPDPHDALLDRLLDEHLAGGSEQLAPSSGFIASVMESIQTEVAAPPPLAFPWRRALPGALAALCGLIGLMILILRSALRGGAISATARTAPRMQLHFPLNFTPGEMTLGWILLAACLSVAAIAASFRLTGRSQ